MHIKWALFAILVVNSLGASPAAPECTFPLPSAASVGEPAFRKSLYAFLELATAETMIAP